VTRPPWEVADIIRIAGSKFRERYGASLTWPQIKVLRAIARCRTAALGGHRDVCTGCGYVTGISYNSCRNRHCLKCQTGARETWLAKRQQELLPVNYFHFVFSLPHSLVPLIWQNKKVLFTLSFDASAATLPEVAADPKIRYLQEASKWKRLPQLLDDSTARRMLRDVNVQDSSPT
jgi:Transposase zinc-binding domain